jgi:glutamate carboxypeptidase
VTPYTDTLDWIDRQHARLRRDVTAWAGINTGTDNLDGLARLTARVAEAAAPLGATAELIELPPVATVDSAGRFVPRPLGRALRLTRRPDAARRAFLCIHVDTVYSVDHAFQSVTLLDEDTLRGPGVADAKGGLVVMLAALDAFERSPFAERLGWEVLINPDEEIGSPGSALLLADAARRSHFGLVFEPALPDGAMVDRRRGVGNFDVVVRGRSAHAGRDFAAGRNAVVAAARLAVALDQLNATIPDATVNVGRFEGGGAVNVVPDLAVCRINVRTTAQSDEAAFLEALQDALAATLNADGISAELHGGFTSPPKLVDAPTLRLMDHVTACGRDLNVPITWRPSGGACDGNKLAAAGLPTVDTLGPRGGDLHSSTEYLRLDSLTERAKLTALLLMKLASGELPLPGRGGAKLSEPT